MSMMTSQILNFVDFTKTQKPRYLETDLHIKDYFMAKNTFVAQVTFKLTHTRKQSEFLVLNRVASFTTEFRLCKDSRQLI